MVRGKVVIKNPTGLHLRPAGKLSNLAAGFSCSIRICKGNQESDAKSLLALLGACIKVGDEVEFICEGDDEQEALDALLELINSGMSD